MSKGEVSELLKPRVKCIGNDKWHYPFSPYSVGQILYKVKNEPDSGSGFWSADTYSIAKDDFKLDHICLNPLDYPHLFKPLAWYEEREASEMPRYLKDKDGVYEMKDYESNGDIKTFMVYNYQAQRRGSGWSLLGEYALKYFDPATETEYNQYLKTKQK